MEILADDPNFTYNFGSPSDRAVLKRPHTLQNTFGCVNSNMGKIDTLLIRYASFNKQKPFSKSVDMG
jgi:hypothetical protein